MSARLWEAWFKCGCTKIAPRGEIVEYCPVHGEERVGLVIYNNIDPASPAPPDASQKE